jgi:hypothetical protein
MLAWLRWVRLSRGREGTQEGIGGERGHGVVIGHRGASLRRAASISLVLP